MSDPAIDNDEPPPGKLFNLHLTTILVSTLFAGLLLGGVIKETEAERLRRHISSSGDFYFQMLRDYGVLFVLAFAMWVLPIATLTEFLCRRSDRKKQRLE